MTQIESVPTEPPIEVPSLAGDFPKVSHEQWEVLVAKVMNRGRPEDKQLTPEQSVARLRVTTADGVTIEPLYTAPDDATAPAPTGAPGVMPFTRGRQPLRPSTSWDIRAFHDDPDTSVTRQAILTDLERGATSVWVRVGGDGVAAADLAEVLADVRLDLAPVAVQAADDQGAAAAALKAVWDSSGVAAQEIRGSLGIDPFGMAARRGGDIDTGTLREWAATIRSGYPGVVPITVDVRPYHDAGAGDVEELAFAVATAIEYVRELDDAAISPQEAFDLIEFRVVVTDDQFSSIAKLRALRRLWARIGEVLEVAEPKRGARTHAVTSWRMMTRDDPYVNMLRTTIAVFAGAVGNADAVTVFPFDNALGRPDSFSRRIARNTQVILADESSLGRVADPAGGSFYAEALTDELAGKAWELFGRIEADGGMRAILESGRAHEIVASVQAERDKRLATRTEPLTGVSTFPNLEEKRLKRNVRTPLAARKGKVRQFQPRRDSDVYERLRNRAELAAEQPVALLVGLGTRRDFGAREGFASPLLAAGGIKGQLIEVSSPDDIADRVAGNPSKVAVVCSSPKVNGEWGGAAVKALRDAGVEHVCLAGNVKELGDAADSVDGAIFMGCNVVETTTTMLDQLGVPAVSTEFTSQQGAGA